MFSTTLPRAAVALGLILVPVAAGAAWDRIENRPPRLGQYTNTAPHRSGLNYLVPAQPSYARTGRPTGAAPAAPAEPVAIPGAPWTQEWRERCAREHKTFDAMTGTYLTPSGQYKFCQ